MKLAPLYLFLLLFHPAYTQYKNFKNEFGFRSDNDSFLALGQDRYYTNGLFLNLRHAIKSDSLRHGVLKKIIELDAGQYMFNPYTGKISSIDRVDRPFAAYLYAGAGMKWFYQNESVLDVRMNAGTIGPNAKGREVQETLHNIIGFYEIRGWEYQVNNEVGFNASINYSKLLSRRRKNNDLSLNSYLNVGNTFTGVGAGVLFRLGKINSFSNSVSYNSRISNSLGDSIPKKELFFFTRPMLNYIGYDATVQGAMFSADKGPITFDPNRVQYSHELGINYAANRWTLNFSVTFKSKDVKTQRSSHQFGSAMIFYRF